MASSSGIISRCFNHLISDGCESPRCKRCASLSDIHTLFLSGTNRGLVTIGAPIPKLQDRRIARNEGVVFTSFSWLMVISTNSLVVEPAEIRIHHVVYHVPLAEECSPQWGHGLEYLRVWHPRGRPSAVDGVV